MDELDCCDWLAGKLGRPCTFQGKSVKEHCAGGMHCTSTTSSCAAELSADDHPRKCCDCKEDME